MNVLNDLEARIGDDATEGASVVLQEKMHKLRKKIDPDVLEELEAMEEAELRARIVQCELNEYEVVKARESDVALRELKLKVKEASAPYSEGVKEQRTIATYASCLLDMKGCV